MRFKGGMHKNVIAIRHEAQAGWCGNLFRKLSKFRSKDPHANQAVFARPTALDDGDELSN